MQNGLKKIDIFINKTIPSVKENETNKYYTFKFKDIEKYLRPNITIVDIGSQNSNLLKEINEYLENKCIIIGYDTNIDEIINSRKKLPDDNVMFIYSHFLDNILENNSVDLIIGKNILGDQKNSKILKELYRVLKNNSNFIFLELVSMNKPRNGFIKHFSKRKDHIFNNIIFDFQKKLKKIKNSEYDIKILGNGNFYFNSNDVNSLQEFCDIGGFKSHERENILSEILVVIISGTLYKK